MEDIIQRISHFFFWHSTLSIRKEMEYQTTLPVFWVTCMRVKKQQLEWDMEQLTGSKLEKEYIVILII